MSDLLRLFFVIAFLTLGLAAYFLVVSALFPNRVARTKSAIQSTPARSFGIGLVNFVFFAVIAIALFSGAEKSGPFIKTLLTIPALLITALLATMLSFGLAGMTSLIGERILPELTSWRQSILGTVCLCFACAPPFVGWFLLFPYAGLVGIGAFILGLFQREPKS